MGALGFEDSTNSSGNNHIGESRGTVSVRDWLDACPVKLSPEQRGQIQHIVESAKQHR
jgi:hypothetical protein